MIQIPDNYIKILKIGLTNYLFITLIFFGIKYFNLHYIGMMVVFNVIRILFGIYQKLSIYKIIKSIIITDIFLSIIYFLQNKFLIYGILGYIFFIILIAIYKIYIMWDVYVWGVTTLLKDIFKLFGKENNLKPKLYEINKKYEDKMQKRLDKNADTK